MRWIYGSSTFLLSPHKPASYPAGGGSPILGQHHGWGLGTSACSSDVKVNGMSADLTQKHKHHIC